MNEQLTKNRPSNYPDWTALFTFGGRAPINTVYFLGGNKIESYVVYPSDESISSSLDGADFVDLLFDKCGNCFGWSYNATEGSLYPGYMYSG